MLTDLQLAIHRYEGYAEKVIAPAVVRRSTPLDVAAFQCPQPISYADALAASYTAVPIGWRWGPVWSTCWFKATGRLPDAVRETPLELRFSAGTEALLWIDGVPHQGFDRNRDRALLPAAVGRDGTVTLLVEAACNHPLGATSFWWDAADTRERWRSAEPGELARCELVIVDDAVERCLRTYRLAVALLRELAEESPRAHTLNTALRRATRLLDDRDVAASADAAHLVLDAALRAGAAPSATTCIAAGHAHIDTAWLWPLRETRRKCLRTFANVLRLMERWPAFTFTCSQAQHYAFVERDAPELFEAIRTRVREGRWEVTGAMWVEPDCNIPSGESLVRQIMHGVRYWRQRFGDHARQRLLYLPDTFGFTPALPQIMELAGLDTFITNKLSWSQVNRFPHVSFRWRGLDGSTILAHVTPGHDYNAALTPIELRRGERNVAQLGRGLADVWLQPFGFGDGGGGPTADALHRAASADAIEGLPVVRLGGAHVFCDALHRERAQLRADGRDLPVWDGELYLELHRGTYTTQAWLKAANRRAEERLRAAEWLHAGGLETPDETLVPTLDAAWKLVLLNQFHDILPGTSIPAVYADAREQHARVETTCDRALSAGRAAWARRADTRGMTRPMIVFNPHAVTHSAVIVCDDELHHVRDVPALGVAVRDRAQPTRVAPVRVDGFTLANGLLAATVDERGRLGRLVSVATGRDAGHVDRAGVVEPLNQLVLYEDRPRSWEAWDIDAEHRDTPYAVDAPLTHRRVVAQGPLRAAIEVARPLGEHSVITQRYVLDAGSPRLDIETHVTWRERRRLLRALFPVGVRARSATYEVAFGHLERPTHQNTSWEQAQFEVCAHRWMDLSQPGFGVALLNDSKYGHSCVDHCMGLTLLRGTSFPDPDADQGEQRFTYGVMPHDGDWRAARVDREAALLNTPLVTQPLPPETHGDLAADWAPFDLSGAAAAGIDVAAVKRAEQDERLVVRLVETHGRAGRVVLTWRLAIDDVEAVDLLERPRRERLAHDRATGRTVLDLRPFQIVTLAARRAATRA